MFDGGFESNLPRLEDQDVSEVGEEAKVDREKELQDVVSSAEKKKDTMDIVRFEHMGELKEKMRIKEMSLK